MNHVTWLVLLLALAACGRDGAADRARASNDSQRTIGPLPMDSLNAALEAYHAKRISADSAAALIASFQQRTGRTFNIEMDAELLAAMERRNQRRTAP